jgi:predicted alpha/beta hydrolase
MLELYQRADIETRWIDPSDLNLSSIGHLGFFYSDVRRPLWDEALDWLTQRA